MLEHARDRAGRFVYACMPADGAGAWRLLEHGESAGSACIGLRKAGLQDTLASAETGP